MKYLFVVRHGIYGSDNRLNARGKEQMRILGEAMKGKLNGSSIHLVSSTAPRALDSSEVLREVLGVGEVEEIPYLWSGGDCPRDVRTFNEYNPDSSMKVMQLIQERRERVDGLIMVTHLEVTRHFPSYFVKQEFGKKEWLDELSKGQAVYFDLDKKESCVLP